MKKGFASKKDIKDKKSGKKVGTVKKATVYDDKSGKKKTFRKFEKKK